MNEWFLKKAYLDVTSILNSPPEYSIVNTNERTIIIRKYKLDFTRSYKYMHMFFNNVKKMYGLYAADILDFALYDLYCIKKIIDTFDTNLKVMYKMNMYTY